MTLSQPGDTLERRVLVAGTEKKTFVQQDDRHRPALDELRNMGLPRAMRTLDGLRKHSPTEAEGESLGASGRLDVQVGYILCMTVEG